MANRKEGIARRHRRTAQQPAQRPGAPTLHQAEVAASPLPLARCMLTIKDVVDRVLERLWRRSLAPGVQSPAAGAIDGMDETKISTEQKPRPKNQAFYQRACPVRAAAVDPAAAMPHPPRLSPVECPLGTYKNIIGSSKSSCSPCPSNELPHHAIYEVLLKLGHSRNNDALMCKRITSRWMLNDKRDLFYPLSLILHNTKPVGHQDLVGLVISILLLADIEMINIQ